MMDDILFKKWYEWIDIIYLDIRPLLIIRYVFRKVKDIIKNNPKINKHNLFYDFLGSVYVDSAVMGIRRHVKISGDSISFARLLKEICDKPEILSRKRFVNLYKGSGVENVASEDFDDLVGKGRNYINPNRVKSDLKKLKKIAKKCEKYADWKVAHIDKQAIKKNLTLKGLKFKDIDSCIDFLEELIKKYYFLFRALDLPYILPTPQYDWETIFREPWLPS